MTADHEYLSTACWHEINDGRLELHAECRATCKYGEDGPEYCRCSNHTEDELRASPVSWVDQARDIARDLLEEIEASAPTAMSTALRNRIQTDPALFWLRGEELPPSEWKSS